MNVAEILMAVEYRCTAAADGVLSLLLVAFSGAAQRPEPRSGPVPHQAGAAGERVRHTVVSR